MLEANQTKFVENAVIITNIDFESKNVSMKQKNNNERNDYEGFYKVPCQEGSKKYCW
jgi:hypothetical protein